MNYTVVWFFAIVVGIPVVFGIIYKIFNKYLEIVRENMQKKGEYPSEALDRLAQKIEELSERIDQLEQNLTKDKTEVP